MIFFQFYAKLFENKILVSTPLIFVWLEPMPDPTHDLISTIQYKHKSKHRCGNEQHAPGAGMVSAWPSSTRTTVMLRADAAVTKRCAV